MTGVKIRCPECGWILGDTEKSIDCYFNCPKHNRVKISMKVATYSDYYKIIKKGGGSE